MDEDIVSALVKASEGARNRTCLIERRKPTDQVDRQDFDGDALNGMLCLDEYTADKMMGLLPHKSAFNLEAPRELSKNLSLSKPSVSIYNNWMSTPSTAADPVKLERMKKFQ